LGLAVIARRKKKNVTQALPVKPVLSITKGISLITPVEFLRFGILLVRNRRFDSLQSHPFPYMIWS
jgi:hypothetical protein